MQKVDLRRTVRARLSALAPGERARKSAEICRAVAATPEWEAARTVGFFAPLPEEPDVDLLWAVLGERAVCYPRMVGPDLLFLSVPNRTALLEPARWSLREPPHDDERLVEPEELDLLFVPGMAFTADGHRMGRGKGFYDRYLAAPGLRCTTFGICFAEQLFPRLPQEPHDRLVSRVFAA